MLTYRFLLEKVLPSFSCTRNSKHTNQALQKWNISTVSHDHPNKLHGTEVSCYLAADEWVPLTLQVRARNPDDTIGDLFTRKRIKFDLNLVWNADSYLFLWRPEYLTLCSVECYDFNCRWIRRDVEGSCCSLILRTSLVFAWFFSLCNPILFAICTSIFSKLCENMYTVACRRMLSRAPL
jgi:hypothetical protein